MLQEGFDFRTKDECSIPHRIEQRIDAEVIASEKQRLLFTVVDDKSKLSIKLVQKIDAFVFVQMQQHFNIAVGAEHVSFLLERISELTVIVDLAIAEQHE